MDADAAAAGCGSGGTELRYLWMQWTPASSEVSVPTLSPQHAPSRHRSLWVAWKTNCSNWLLGRPISWNVMYVCKTCSRLCNSRSFKFIRRQNAPKYAISRHQIQKFSPELSPMGRRQSLPTPNHPRRLDSRAFGT